MNVFNQFLIFPLRKFEPFRDYVYYSLIDRDLFFFDKPGENEMILTSLQPYLTEPGVRGNLIFPVIFNRDFIQTQTLNHGRPSITNINTGIVTSLSVLNFSRDQYSNSSALVSASFINKKGNIQYVEKNIPRFEASQTRVNVLCSSTAIPRFPSFKSLTENQNGIDHTNLVYETISGAALRNQWDGPLWMRSLFGWEHYCGALHDLETVNDVPYELRNIITSSQFFYLSTCQGCGGAGNPYSGVRNSPLAIYFNTGNLAIPYIDTFEVGYNAQQVDSNWKRYSITIPAAYWAWRRGAPSPGFNPRNSGLWDKWNTLENGTNGRIQHNVSPSVTCALISKPFGGMGAYQYWGPQLEYGLSATNYEFTGYEILSGGRNRKNLIAPLTGSNFRGGLWSFWRHTGNDSINNVRIHSISTDTPFGINLENPSYILQGVNVEDRTGFHTNVDLRVPEPSDLPGTNLIRNTDFSGAEVGDVFRVDSNGNSSDWYGDYKGRGPYWQSIFTRSRNTFIQIVSTGKIDGNNFVDYRIYRPSGSISNNDFGNHEIELNPEGWTYILANNGETFTFTVSCALISGNFPGTWSGGSAISPTTLLPTSAMFIGIGFTGFNNTIGANDNLSYFLNGTGGGLRRHVNSLTFSNSLTALTITTTANNSRISRVTPEIRIPRVPAVSAFDFTIRLCGPKLERGSIVTEYVPSPTVIHSSSAVTFSCYIRYISGGQPSWDAPQSRSRGVGGLIQRTGWVDPTLIYNNVQITNSMYVKIDGIGLPENAKVAFNLGITDSKKKRFYATKNWQRVQYTQFYNKFDSGFDNQSDGRGFQFYVDRLDAENIGFNPNTTKFYFTGLQSEISSDSSTYIPTPQGQIAFDNDIDGLLIEPSRSNLAQYSTRFNHISAPTNKVVVQTSGAFSPDNITTTQVISCLNTTSFLYLTGCNSGEVDKKYVISFYIKPLNSSNLLYITQHPLHNGSTTSFQLDALQNRIIGVSRSNNTDSYGIDSLPRGWRRVYYTTTCNSNNGKIWPGFGLASNTTSNQFYLWGLQIEKGDTPTSYIPVNNFIGTRERDILALSGSNLWFLYKNNNLPTTLVSNNSSTIFLESKRKYIGSSNQKLFQIEERGGVLQTPISFATTIQQLSSSLYNTGLTLNIPGTWFNTNIKTAFTFNNISDRFALASSGVSVSGSYTRNILLSAYYFGGSDYNGYIQKIIIFPEVINKADIEIITT